MTENALNQNKGINISPLLAFFMARDDPSKTDRNTTPPPPVHSLKRRGQGMGV